MFEFSIRDAMVAYRRAQLNQLLSTLPRCEMNYAMFAVSMTYFFYRNATDETTYLNKYLLSWWRRTQFYAGYDCLLHCLS